MKAVKTIITLLMLFVLPALTHAQESASIPTKDTASVITLADPAIFRHNNQYYLYGTVEGNSGNGFLVYTSGDLKNWKLSEKNSGYALRKGDAFGTTGFWAPQVFKWQNKFYMAYVANENIAIATSDDPLGPFVQGNVAALSAPVKQIDPYVFIDEDGKKYLYHVRLTEGNKIFVAEMLDDFSAIKPETVRECIVAEQGWENTAQSKWPVAEGPAIIKRQGVYYLFYTANDFRNPDYAVGYATSSTPFGPWQKWQGNPIISRNLLGINGTGHGDFIQGEEKLLYVMHTHQHNSKVAPRKTALIEMQWKRKKKQIVVEARKKTFRYLIQK